MKQLFKCQTIAQFKLMSWLVMQGVTRDDIARVELLGPDKVRVTNPAGQYMVVIWTGDHAEIEAEPLIKTPEAGEEGRTKAECENF